MEAHLRKLLGDLQITQIISDYEKNPNKEYVLKTVQDDISKELKRQYAAKMTVYQRVNYKSKTTLPFARFAVGCLHYFNNDIDKALELWNKKNIADESYFALGLYSEFIENDIDSAIETYESLVYDYDRKTKKTVYNEDAIGVVILKLIESYKNTDNVKYTELLENHAKGYLTNKYGYLSKIALGSIKFCNILKTDSINDKEKRTDCLKSYSVKYDAPKLNSDILEQNHGRISLFFKAYDSYKVDNSPVSLALIAEIAYSCEKGISKKHWFDNFYVFREEPPGENNPILVDIEIAQLIWAVVEDFMKKDQSTINLDGLTLNQQFFILYSTDVSAINTSKFRKMMSEFSNKCREQGVTNKHYLGLRDELDSAVNSRKATPVAPRLPPSQRVSNENTQVRHGLHPPNRNDILSRFFARRKTDEPKKNKKMVSVKTKNSPNNRNYGSDYLYKPLFEPLPEILKKK